ncbi:MAG TPA: superoxide dismutase family protein [Variovorax sp.]
MHFPRTPRWFAPVLAVLAAGCLSACGSLGPAPAASANLVPTGAIVPNPTMGKVTFTPLEHGLRIAVDVHGLAPGTEHGFHVHETGDCGDNGNAAGGHFNPSGGTHGKFGAPGSHAGDLPSLVADASGNARFSVDVHTLSMTDGAANNVIGRSVVVHRDRDDFTTQPAGNSGPRIACGVITRN